VKFRYAALLVAASTAIAACSGGGSSRLSPTAADGSLRSTKCVPSIVNNTCTSPSTPKPIPWPGFTNPIADGNFVNAEANFWDVATGSGFGPDLPGFWYSCAEDETTHLSINTPTSTTTTTQAPGGPSIAGVPGPMTVINFNNYPTTVSGLEPWSAQIGSSTAEAPAIVAGGATHQVLYGICYDFTVPTTPSNLSFYSREMTNEPLQVAGPGVTFKGYQTAAILAGPVPGVGQPFPAITQIFYQQQSNANVWTPNSYTLEEFRGQSVTVFFGIESPGLGTDLEQLIAGVSVPAATPPPVTQTLYAVAPVLTTSPPSPSVISGPVFWNQNNQQLLSYSAQGNGAGMLLQTMSFPGPTAPTAQIFTGSFASISLNTTEIFRASNGSFWFTDVTNFNTTSPLYDTDGVVTCTPVGNVCQTGSAPTIGVNNPAQIALDSTGRLAVLNGDGSIAVFAAGATASSTPTGVISASDAALSGFIPSYLGFDSAGNLWVDTQSGGGLNGAGYAIGSLVEFAPNANGQAIPLQNIPMPGVLVGPCPFAINVYGQIWINCMDYTGQSHVYNIYEKTGMLISRWDGPVTGMGLASQVSVDAVDVYFSDTDNSRVVVYSNAAPSQTGPYRELSGLSYPGGIALH